MNNNNIVYKFEEGHLHAEWGDLAPDDDERSTGKLIKASVPAESADDRLAYKKVNTLLCRLYDEWIQETRN